MGGFERVFEIGRQFRNEGMDQYHNPEFTTMEAYQAFSDLEGMKRLTQGFIRAAAMAACGTLSINYQGVDIDLGGTWRDASMIELINEHIDEPISYDMSREELARIAKKNGVVDIEPAWGKGKIISELFEARVEDTLVQPTFVCDHPLEISPLAKKREDNPELTYRFELFICGHEYANAFSELNDPIDQAERFLAQVQAKDMGDDEAMGYDADYIRALEYGMPPAGGVGIGIDRLVMLLTNAESIRDVLLFPTMKPLNDAQVCDVNALDAAESKEQENSAATGCDSAAAAQPASLSNAPHQQADASIDFSNVSIEPLFKDFVDFDTFSKSDFRAVKVKACSAVPKSKKLLQFTLDDGTGCDRTILSGIHAFYEPEQLVGKTCIAITNLPPRTMMGIDSCGMLISAIHEEAGCEKLHLLMVDDHIPAGAKLY
ncbi:putative methionine--tRNA ligase, beta subunit [Umbribacter vaginalis]|nr:putative methionine--tRNA ligase, beta subunit [Coriobacteriales bacterium DNF00809]